MIESTPRIVSEEEVNDPSLVIGVCKCPVPMTYGHVFKKSDYPGGRISYVCTECGTKTDLIFKTELYISDLYPETIFKRPCSNCENEDSINICDQCCFNYDSWFRKKERKEGDAE